MRRDGGRGQVGEQPPPELEAAFAAHPGSRQVFDALPPAHRREYVAWIAAGRRTEARSRRAAQTVMRLMARAAGDPAP